MIKSIGGAGHVVGNVFSIVHVLKVLLISRLTGGCVVPDFRVRLVL